MEVPDNLRGKDKAMSRNTMSRTRVVAGSGAALLMLLVLPAGQSVAADDDGGVDVPTCLAPITQPAHSADVMQGWIDGCRRTEAARAAVSLGNYL